MSKASVGAKVGTLIVGAIKGKKSAAATAAAYAKAKASKAAVKAIPKTKLAEPSKASVKVKPAAKTKPKPPNPNQIEHKFGMRNNRMINQGVPVEARASGGGSRRDAIAESKLTGKPIKNTKPKLVMESVKVLPRKTAPKTDLSNRGAKLTKAQRAERAQDYQFDKSLGKYYSNQDRIAGTDPSELARGSRGEGVKSARKTAAIKKEATKENFYERIRNPIKINTNPTKPKGVFGPLKKKLAAADTPANRAKATNNARGLKAANKPVSKNNRNRFGDGEMSAYLKSTKPARANRTRLGNTANKKGK